MAGPGDTSNQDTFLRFLQQTILAVRQYSLKLMSRHVSVITSRLGDQAGIYGACLIARDKVIDSLGRE